MKTPSPSPTPTPTPSPTPPGGTTLFPLSVHASGRYLQGANGYLLVVDGTRDGTVNVARMLERKVRETIGPLPFVVLANKCDLEEQWEVRRGEFRAMTAEGWTVMRTSAKTGEGVEAAFLALARKFVSGPDADGPVRDGVVGP